MITKDELIARLGQLRRKEELAIPACTQHLESAFFLSHVKPEVQKEIKEMLLALATESKAHVEMFGAMIEKVKESKRDIY